MDPKPDEAAAIPNDAAGTSGATGSGGLNDELDALLNDALSDFGKPPPENKAQPPRPSRNQQKFFSQAWSEEFIKDATAQFEKKMREYVNSAKPGALGAYGSTDSFHKVVDANSKAALNSGDLGLEATLNEAIKSLTSHSEGMQVFQDAINGDKSMNSIRGAVCQLYDMLKCTTEQLDEIGQSLFSNQQYQDNVNESASSTNDKLKTLSEENAQLRRDLENERLKVTAARIAQLSTPVSEYTAMTQKPRPATMAGKASLGVKDRSVSLPAKTNSPLSVPPSTPNKENKGKLAYRSRISENQPKPKSHFERNCMESPKSYFQKSSMESTPSSTTIDEDAVLLVPLIPLNRPTYQNRLRTKPVRLTQSQLKQTYVCSELEPIINPVPKDLSYEEALQKIDQQMNEAAKESRRRVEEIWDEEQFLDKSPAGIRNALALGYAEFRKSAAYSSKNGNFDTGPSKEDKQSNGCTTPGPSPAKKRGECKGNTPSRQAKTRKTTEQIQLDAVADELNNMFEGTPPPPNPSVAENPNALTFIRIGSANLTNVN